LLLLLLVSGSCGDDAGSAEVLVPTCCPTEIVVDEGVKALTPVRLSNAANATAFFIVFFICS